MNPPQTRNAKNPPLNRPSENMPPPPRGGLVLGNCPQIQSKNGTFPLPTVNKILPSNYKASPIDFETQISLPR